MSNHSQFLDSYQTQLKVLLEQASEKIKEEFSLFWNKNPAVKTVIWTQYAPYFNDGDPCEFSVNSPSFTNAEGDDVDDINWGEYEGKKENIWVLSDANCYGGFPPESTRREGVDHVSMENLTHLLTHPVMEDAMEFMFGEDCKVIATREGFSSDYFPHQ